MLAVTSTYSICQQFASIINTGGPHLEASTAAIGFFTGKLARLMVSTCKPILR